MLRSGRAEQIEKPPLPTKKVSIRATRNCQMLWIGRVS